MTCTSISSELVQTVSKCEMANQANWRAVVCSPIIFTL